MKSSLTVFLSVYNEKKKYTMLKTGGLFQDLYRI